MQLADLVLTRSICSCHSRRDGLKKRRRVRPATPVQTTPAASGSNDSPGVDGRRHPSSESFERCSATNRDAIARIVIYIKSEGGTGDAGVRATTDIIAIATTNMKGFKESQQRMVPFRSRRCHCSGQRSCRSVTNM
ncbi:hypothetical protein EVAR_84018_1 [Eumeta japonica]|uniref:Uncharacterized protein n=1 Tax=Eumeta variegata TaxID=151549 RepID=A0A4C1X6N3_EUMVA|nr:hypothetical protein EVAR_84018_1 [Eumeta japonica]